ncbi:N,N-dimethylformamidase beta subunit family domain-containing protein [Zavarzinia sp. CC-PAN008]|uniref:N,N-dimethylformamidase beta subunit family domain-containing protein n=1 Tax=Zavarzinia sp. CC-PAN008 TaxID=3243332 RepID=UPI003F74377C
MLDPAVRALFRADLAAAFDAAPAGPHEPSLGLLLDVMRFAPLAGKAVTVRLDEPGAWALGTLPGRRGVPVAITDRRRFRDPLDAERAVFRARWKALTGEEAPLPPLDIAEDDAAIQPPRKQVLAYADRWSVRAGEALAVRVSLLSGREYEVQVVRLFSGEVDLRGDGLGLVPVAAPCNGRHMGRAQPLPAGSYGTAPWRGPAQPDALTVQAFVMPTLPGDGAQQVLAIGTALQLVLDEAGHFALRTDAGAELVAAQPATPSAWVLVAGSWGDGRLSLAVGDAVVTLDLPGWCPTLAEGAQVVLSAPSGAGFDGRIDRPRVALGVLDPATSAALSAPRPPADLLARCVLALDLAQDMAGRRMVDLSPSAAHGTLHQLPMRAVRGQNWHIGVHDWRQDPTLYGAVHFHRDDLNDACWDTDFAWDVPDDLESGVYAVRLRAGGDCTFVPVFVRPAMDSATRDAAFLVPTCSYLAYGNEHGAMDSAANEVMGGALPGLKAEDLFLQEVRALGHSQYDSHGDGSGVAFSSRLRPMLNVQPGKPLAWLGSGGVWPWQFAADLDIVGWLTALGQPVDIVTDEDLHAEGAAALAPYRVVLTGSHPEYHSIAMLDGIAAWQAAGGRLMYLGGNGFYWRVAFSDAWPGTIELRRAEDGIRDWQSAPGEYHHAFTGELGGLWRRIGRPPQMLCGVGFAGQGMDQSTYYLVQPGGRDPRATFILDGIADERIGDFGTIGGGAAGLEYDRADDSLGTPRHALVVASSFAHSRKTSAVPEEVDTVLGIELAQANPRVRSDIVFYETPGGGAVFSTGSIAWAGALNHGGGGNSVSRLTANVLARFLDPTPFRLP